MPDHLYTPSVAQLATHLRGLTPSCGPVRLVAVDGHAGAGKSTLAGHLAAALDDAPILPLDDLASHDAFFGWDGRMRHQVIDPFLAGEPARFAVYDWTRGAFTSSRVLRPAPLVLIEGVGSGRRALRPYLSCLLWLEVPREVCWRRGRTRDGPALTAFWERWTRAEREHFATDPSRPHADLLVRPL